MSQGANCKVHSREHWKIAHYKHNHSAFNGYHRTRSDYTEVVCTAPVEYASGLGICGHRWRTKAAWVDTLPSITRGACAYVPS